MASPVEPRTPWLRYVWAATLGLALLGMTYTLFDPDLGTPVPLFQEFTCRGDLEVIASDAADRPRLLMPETAVKMRALWEGSPRPAYFTIYKREAGEEWSIYFSIDIPSGENLLYVAPITNDTEVYVAAKDLEGKHCRGKSDIIRPLPPEAAPAPNAS